MKTPYASKADIIYTAGLSALTVFHGLYRLKYSLARCAPSLEPGLLAATGQYTSSALASPEKRSNIRLFRLTQFIITKSLPYIFTSMGYGTWFFFGTWLLIAVAWAFFFLPETKGVSIDQMDLLLYVRLLLLPLPHANSAVGQWLRGRQTKPVLQGKHQPAFR